MYEETAVDWNLICDMKEEQVADNRDINYTLSSINISIHYHPT